MPLGLDLSSLFGQTGKVGKGPIYVIGLDATTKNVKIMQTKGASQESATFAYFPLDERLLNEGNYAATLETVLPEYFGSMTEKSYNAYVVLPDNTVTVDFISLPALSTSKQMAALKVQLEENYVNVKDLVVNVELLNNNKRTVSYMVGVMQRKIVTDLYTVCANNKINLLGVTCEGNATLNALLGLTKINARHPFIFANVKNDSTLIAFNGKSGAMGFTSLPFGYDILESETVIDESQLYDHYVAELAVVNATEIAKAKKLSVANMPEEDKLPELNTEAAEADATAEDETEEAAEEAATDATRDEDEDFDGEEAAPTPETPSAKKQKVFVKKARKLPKFMQRPIPETPEAMTEENFRNFLKRFLGYKQFCEQSEYMETPEQIIVKMPERYAYLAGRLNTDAENGIEFRFFDEPISKNVEIADNLDLYGAISAKTHGRCFVFAV